MYNTDLPARAELPSTRTLLRSTFVAALIAVGLLVSVVLPAEYGIDPTGVGRWTGLTQMGEIKVALAAQAKAPEQPAATSAVTPEVAAPALAAVPVPPPMAKPVADPLAKPATAPLRHSTTFTLKPGQAAEIKLVMRKGAVVNYQWSAEGGPVNFDAHGDPFDAPKNFYHGYGKGRNQTGDSGVLQAAFDGKHGWFWRNRSGGSVTITLKTGGDYEKLERVI